MPQIKLTKVTLLEVSRKSPTAGTAKFSCSLTKALAEAMEWGKFTDENGRSIFEFEIPEWQRTSSPNGKLNASRVELEPKAGIGTTGREISLDATSVTDFQIIRKEAEGKASKQTKATKTELHFKVTFSDDSGCAKLERYMRTANIESTMTVVYEKEPEQGTLPGTDGAALEEQVKEIAKKRGKEVN